ncbi:unnamed protein product [Brachionus calyciflorus]|uniref:Uncharacterized protein n=1 Tax=Brachionus calyciflorus TaxID=104777 RepID=A0A814PDV0_9BILA|nr:unnamed protein product [Brachionus calyciflorus]
MMLYILAIEDLLLRIKQNKNKGYNIYGLEAREIKASAYADDIVGYVSEKLSIQLFFQEFDECEEISGASNNREKMVIMEVNNSEEIEDFGF